MAQESEDAPDSLGDEQARQGLRPLRFNLFCDSADPHRDREDVDEAGDSFMLRTLYIYYIFIVMLLCYVICYISGIRLLRPLA